MASLSKERLDAFLAQPLIARLGVVTDDGDPYVVPIWYDWTGDGLLIAVRAKAKYVPSLRSGRRACLSIAEDAGELRRALITGRVEVVRDAAPDTGEWLERSRAMCRRYLGEEGGDDYQDETLARPCIWFKIHADEVVSWDSPNWHPRYL
jgi:nitroimidazol reductase NimA-like FMN-containing flavoprotein (pyridoxamine 5'-phosphate oxidase superfamily)